MPAARPPRLLHRRERCTRIEVPPDASEHATLVVPTPLLFPDPCLRWTSYQRCRHRHTRDGQSIASARSEIDTNGLASQSSRHALQPSVDKVRSSRPAIAPCSDLDNTSMAN